MKKLISIVALFILAACSAPGQAFPVYIGNSANYLIYQDNYVRLYSASGFVFGVGADGNGRVGWGETNSTRSFTVVGTKPAEAAGASGTSAATSGSIQLTGGAGGDTSIGTTGTGGAGADIRMFSGAGGVANSATTATTGGEGGSMDFRGGNGGSPNVAATTATGGNGGVLQFAGGAGGNPTLGTSRNGGDGGSLRFFGGASSPGSGGGNPGNGGIVTIRGGAGSTGATNSNGGNVFITGGSAGSGAAHGNINLNAESDGTVQGNTILHSGVGYAVSTNSVFSDSTNRVADFDRPYGKIFASADVHFIQSTNRTETEWKNAVFKIYAGGSDRSISFNTNWLFMGNVTNKFTLASGMHAIVSIATDGLSETNVFFTYVTNSVVAGM